MSKKVIVKKPLPILKPAKVEDPNAFAKWELYLNTNRVKLLLIIPLVLGTLFALLTFDVKISEGNDDAMYIEAATKYAADFTGYYYTANAPMYPMILGVVTMIAGFNLTLYKLLNVVFFLLHLLLMYAAFRRRIPYSILFPVLLLTAVNSYFLYYASQTYTEMLFVTLQAIFFLVFFKWQEQLRGLVSKSGSSWQSLYNTILPPVPEIGNYPIARIRGALVIGLVLFLMTFCKNIAIGMLGALIVFFVIGRNWKSLIDVVAGYVIVRLSFEGLKTAIWGASDQYGAQSAILLQKDAYNAAAGKEDFNGFITRFFDNFDLYTSKRLFQVLGFKDPDSNETHTILSLLVVFLLAFAAWRIYVELKKTGFFSKIAATTNSDFPRNILLVFIYICTMHFLTYLVLQTRWDQPRLIMVYAPMVVMVILYGLYSYFSKSGLTGRMGYLLVAVVIVGSSLLSTVKKSIANYPVLKKNLQGDLYYGYTADWENFLRLSAWCADSLPEGSLVASRKAPMSFVYGKGKPFFPVYSVPAVDTTTNMSHPDTVLALFRDNKVTHVMLGSLRRNPNKVDGYIINTLHRMLQPVAQKYPEKVRLVKQIGDTEPAYLYEIRD
ncbi:MAG: hypothetical protein M3Q95_07155 [Bacteroidota bacterium]|nr:hypothetical protein [Bacteroidota bacterium]